MNNSSSQFPSKIGRLFLSPGRPCVAHDRKSSAFSAGWGAKKIFRLGALALSLTLAAPLPPAQADEIYHFVIKKQEEKKKSRWSLDEWLATRDRIRLMDMWLAMNSSSPYEFFLEGDYRSAEAAGASFSGFGLSAAAYASLFGLEVQHETLAGSRLHAMFHLRLFGLQDQGTHMTFQAGVRQQSDGPASVRNPFWGGRVAMCFTKFFGFEALIRHYFDSTPGPSGVVASSNRYEGTAFIDYSFARVFGTYFSEPGPSSRTGISLGVKFYF